ncbi:MAG: cell division protein ZapA [Dongiaceae bacterium]
MGQVTLTINGYVYTVACDDGQESHVTELSHYIDKRVKDIAASIGQIGEARLLVMATLLIADELSDAYTELDGLKNQLDGAVGAEKLNLLVGKLGKLANQADHIVESLKKA